MKIQVKIDEKTVEIAPELITVNNIPLKKILERLDKLEAGFKQFVADYNQREKNILDAVKKL